VSKPIVIKITGDTKGVDDAVGHVEGVFDGMSSKAAGIATAIGGAFAIDKVAGFVGDLNGLATELDILDKKTSTVFEGSADTVRAWADANNEALGLSDEKLSGLAAGFGDLLKPMGFTADQAATMSTGVLNLAGALSAWGGGKQSAAEVSDVLAKAMLGERDGLKALGISISEADVQAKLAANGQEKLTGAALQQAKAVATQQLIFEKSTDAQKAWADGSMDAVKNQNTLKATIDDLRATLAEKLQPAFAWVSQFIVSDLIPGFQAAAAAVQDFYENKIRPVIDFLAEHQEILIGVAAAIAVGLVAAFYSWAAGAAAAAAATIAATWPIVAIGAAIAALVAGVIYAYEHWGWFRTAVDTVADVLTEKVWPAIKVVAEWLADHIPPAVSAVIGWFGELWSKASSTFGSIRDAVGWVIDKAGNLVDTVKGLPGKFTEGLSGVAETVTAPFRSAFNGIADLWNSTVGAMSFSIPDWVPVVGGKSWNVPDIPKFAAGGWASGLIQVGERGPETLMVPPNSYVVPNHAQRQAGSVTVYAQTNADPWTIGREVDWALRTAGR